MKLPKPANQQPSWPKSHVELGLVPRQRDQIDGVFYTYGVWLLWNGWHGGDGEYLSKDDFNLRLERIRTDKPRIERKARYAALRIIGPWNDVKTRPKTFRAVLRRKRWPKGVRCYTVKTWELSK